MSRYIFDIDILSDGLKDLKLNSNYKCRPLEYEDYNRGFGNLLSQLTVIGNLDEELFKKRFDYICRIPHVHYIVVIEDIENEKLVACASLIVEYKFFRGAAARGRIEDVVVCSKFRGEKLGQFLIQLLTSLGKKLNCYKITLECNDEFIKFYEKFGYAFEDGNNHLVLRLTPK